MNKQIPYKILRQLKESGFPDDGDPYNTGEYIFGIPQKEIDMVLLGKSSMTGTVDEIFNLSISLDHLIEQCTLDGGQILLWGAGDKWHVQKEYPIEKMPNLKDATWAKIMRVEHITAHTPNAVLAGLWLKLNKK